MAIKTAPEIMAALQKTLNEQLVAVSDDWQINVSVPDMHYKQMLVVNNQFVTSDALAIRYVEGDREVILMSDDLGLDDEDDEDDAGDD